MKVQRNNEIRMFNDKLPMDANDDDDDDMSESGVPVKAMIQQQCFTPDQGDTRVCAAIGPCVCVCACRLPTDELPDQPVDRGPRVATGPLVGPVRHVQRARPESVPPAVIERAAAVV